MKCPKCKSGTLITQKIKRKGDGVYHEQVFCSKCDYVKEES